MAGFSRAAAAAMAIALGGAAVVAPPAYAEGFSFDCDTPADHYSRIEQPVKGTRFHFSGTMASDSLRSGDFAALVQGEVMALDGKSGVRTRLVKSSKEKNTLLMVVFTAMDGKINEYTIGKVKAGSPVGFAFSVADSGNLAVKFGEFAGELPLKLVDGAKLAVSCSTGDFTFTDVRMEERAQE